MDSEIWPRVPLGLGRSSGRIGLVRPGRRSGFRRQRFVRLRNGANELGLGVRVGLRCAEQWLRFRNNGARREFWKRERERQLGRQFRYRSIGQRFGEQLGRRLR